MKTSMIIPVIIFCNMLYTMDQKSDPLTLIINQSSYRPSIIQNQKSQLQPTRPIMDNNNLKDIRQSSLFIINTNPLTENHQTSPSKKILNHNTTHYNNTQTTNTKFKAFNSIKNYTKPTYEDRAMMNLGPLFMVSTGDSLQLTHSHTTSQSLQTKNHQEITQHDEMLHIPSSKILYKLLKINGYALVAIRAELHITTDGKKQPDVLHEYNNLYTLEELDKLMDKIIHLIDNKSKL